MAYYRSVSQILQCIRQISHNAPLCNRNVHMCARFCYNVVHCGILNWCIVGFVWIDDGFIDWQWAITKTGHDQYLWSHAGLLGHNELTLSVLKTEYSGVTRSIPWLLMPWLLASPGHQKPCYWQCRKSGSLSCMRKDFNYLCHLNIEKFR